MKMNNTPSGLYQMFNFLVNENKREMNKIQGRLMKYVGTPDLKRFNKALMGMKQRDIFSVGLVLGMCQDDEDHMKELGKTLNKQYGFPRNCAVIVGYGLGDIK